jgi:hypothetical protein
MMGGRIAAGAAVGALPTAGAIAAGAVGNVCLAIPLVVLAVLVTFVVPLAPFVWGLHHLPLIGSPRVTTTLRLNGNTDMRITVPENDEHTCVLEVGIKNRERWAEVKGAWLNVLVPSGIKVARCDQSGHVEEGGKWEEFHRHQLGTHPRADYWNDINWTFSPGLSRIIRFKLRFGGPGEYPVLLKLGAPNLYDEIQHPATITVTSGEPALTDQMGQLVTLGERLERELRGAIEGSAARTATFAWLYEAFPVLQEAVGDELLPESLKDVDSSELADTVRVHINALYVMRDELGRKPG